MTIPCDNCVYVFTRDKKPKETEFVEFFQNQAKLKFGETVKAEMLMPC